MSERCYEIVKYRPKTPGAEPERQEPLQESGDLPLDLGLPSRMRIGLDEFCRDPDGNIRIINPTIRDLAERQKRMEREE